VRCLFWRVKNYPPRRKLTWVDIQKWVLTGRWYLTQKGREKEREKRGRQADGCRGLLGAVYNQDKQMRGNWGGNEGRGRYGNQTQEDLGQGPLPKIREGKKNGHGRKRPSTKTQAVL